MTMTAMKIMTCAVMVTLFAGGCSRSPEARRDRYLSKGKAFLESREYSRAILEFRNAAQAMPNDAEPYYQLGVASLGSGDVRMAVLTLRKALDLDPKHSGAGLKLAQMMSNASESTWIKEAETRLKELAATAGTSSETLNTLAMTELRLGKPEDAIQTLERALRDAPQDFSLAITMAHAKLLAKDPAGAEAVLLEARNEALTVAARRIVVGEFYLTQNKATEAESEFRAALEFEPANGRALANLARLQRHQGKKREAEETLKRVSSIPAQPYKSLYALFLFEEGRRDEAIRELEKLTQQDPDDRLARTRLIAAYRAVNRTADAEELLHAALKRNGNDLDALLQRAEIFLANGKYPEAEADLNRVLRLRPDSAEVHYTLAKMHQARGALRTYREELAEALKLNPYLLAARFETAEQLRAGNETRAALDVLNAAPETQKQTTPFVVQRNWTLWAAGDFAEMRKAIDAGLARERTPDLLIQDGVWKLRAGNVTAARAALEEALKIDPANIRALEALNLTYPGQKQNAASLQKVKEYAAKQPKSAAIQEFFGMMLAASGDRAEARRVFEAAKAADPKYVTADLSLIQMDVVDGKYDSAHRRLETILAADSSNTVARLWLGNLQAMNGNHDAALQQFRQVVALDANNANALNNLAYLIAEISKQPVEALKYARKAKELAPENPEYSDTLGWILYRQGLYSMAIRELERAAAKEGNPVWKYHLAMAYAKAGNVKRGRATLAAALLANPNMAEAKAARDLLPPEK